MSFRLPFLLIVLFMFMNNLSASSFVGYKKNIIAVKVEENSFQKIDENLFRNGLTGIAGIDKLNNAYQTSVVKKYFKLSESFLNNRNKDLQQWLLISFKDSIDPVEVSKKYSALSDVIVAEPIAIHEIYKTPDDPRVGDQWHINQSNDADIDAYEAWDLQTGNSSIIVAVMDTGVEWWHKDLAGTLADETDRYSIAGNIWINTDELSNTDVNVDEDGNGYNDDWVGWDFVTGNPQLVNLGDDYDVADNNPSDHEGHGTHCAGNVGAINNNGRGVCSAAGGWGEDAQGLGNGAKIMSLRIGWSDFPSGRVSMDFAAQAFIYAAENGAKIATCSWGSSENSALVDAVNTFLYGTTTPGQNDPKIRLIFVAAGNDGNESQNYLNSRDDIVSVAATNSGDDAASFTSYGTWVDISAPGDNILSTDKNGGYVSLSGTSMSTPITASVAALIWSYDTSLTAVQVEDFLYQGADNIDSRLTSKYIGKMGAGRVSARGSLDLIINHAPIAVADTATVNEDDSVKIAVLTNDSDPDGDNLLFSVIVNPQNGSLTQNGDTLVYSPDADFFGADSFRYQLNDNRGGLDTATVRITVNPVNDPPQIVGLPSDLFLNVGDCTSLGMAQYAQDIDTPDSLLSWSFSVDDTLAISYSYSDTTDTLEICSLGPTGTFYLYTTLTDDSGASDQDTTTIHVENPSLAGENDQPIPKKFDLKPNFPNPFNPRTTISYQLAKAEHVQIKIYNTQGQRIMTLIDGVQPAGYYKLNFNAQNLASGIYFYKMKAGSFEKMRKMILLK
ncbi:MAG: S8 family serine peptidase [Calditrichaeota bacterium]|nr:S8 family serine peptidase [Calditrichota bacterium]